MSNNYTCVAKDSREVQNLTIFLIGALDGDQYCYKMSAKWRFTSLQLQRVSLSLLTGLVDPDYKFIWVSVDAKSSASDVTVINNSELKDVVENNI